MGSLLATACSWVERFRLRITNFSSRSFRLHNPAYLLCPEVIYKYVANCIPAKRRTGLTRLRRMFLRLTPSEAPVPGDHSRVGTEQIRCSPEFHFSTGMRNHINENHQD